MKFDVVDGDETVHTAWGWWENHHYIHKNWFLRWLKKPAIKRVICLSILFPDDIMSVQYPVEADCSFDDGISQTVAKIKLKKF